MKKLITAIVITLTCLLGVANASENPFNCADLTIDNVQSIYQNKQAILVKNPYIDGVCVGITFTSNDNGQFSEYYSSIGMTPETVSRMQGDHQHVVQAKTTPGHVFQQIIYVTDGKRADKVASLFGEYGEKRLKREEMMFYHEVSHLIADSLQKNRGVDARELETMADISALRIYAHVNNLTKGEFLDEASHLFRDRQNDSTTGGYSWYHRGLWVEFMRSTDNIDSMEVQSLAGLYEGIFKKRRIVQEKPQDLVGLLASLFSE